MAASPEQHRSVPRKPSRHPKEITLLRGRRWRRERAAFLEKFPLCACGCERLAEEVDHIIPYSVAPHLFWVWSNWQGLTTACHQRKTADENRQRTKRKTSLNHTGWAT